MGLILVGLGGGFLLLTMVANGFRKSFGSSEMNPLIQILPIAAMVILLAGLMTPSSKLLLHIGAVAAIGLIGFCVWNMVYEAATSLGFAVLYLLVWLYFYWRTIHPLTTV